MELFAKLGIDWRLVLAQVINFLILFYVLKHFLYGPVVRTLDARREKIDKGLRDADAAEKKLAEVERAARELLANARKEAKQIVADSEKAATRVHDEIVGRAREEATEVMDHMHRSMQVEKARAIEEVRREVEELVIAAAEKAAKVNIGEEQANRYVKELL